MTNSQMKPNRFLKLQQSKRKLAFIQNAFAKGLDVYLSTMTRRTKYQAKHVDMFRATKSGLYVQRGKGWDCVDGCQITAF